MILSLGRRSKIPVMISSHRIGGKRSMPASAMLPIAAGPSSTPRGARRLWMLMWMLTGIARSCAAAKNGSSSLPRSSFPDGQEVMMQPRAPILRQRSSSAMHSSVPRFGICTRKNSRSGLAEQNSWAM